MPSKPGFQSYVSPKAVLKTTANLGRKPFQKFDRMCKNNYSWPRSVFMLFRPSVQWKLKRKSSECSLEHYWSMIIKQKNSPMHTAGSRVTESKFQSNHVKSCQKPQCAGTALWWTQKKFFTSRDVRTNRAFEITNEMTISQNLCLTSIWLLCIS